MKYGVHLFATEDSIQPAEFAKAAEDRGFESVWFSEHTHIPVKFLNETGVERNLPDYYWQTYDPFIASALAAAATKTIKIGTGVSLILEHDPIALAKTVATVDHISSGRFIFGIGVGWLAEEMENHGVSYSTRYSQADDQISAIKAIWTEQEPQFRGKYVNFSKMKSFPKPLQSPYPLVIGGGGKGEKSLNFIISHCDGWMPIVGRIDWHEIKQGISNLHQRASKLGRDPESIELSIFCWSPPDGSTISDMEASGIKKIVISLEAKDREEALTLIDQYTKLIMS
jgi:probable F420-dependent oxidoreductase